MDETRERCRILAIPLPEERRRLEIMLARVLLLAVDHVVFGEPLGVGDRPRLGQGGQACVSRTSVRMEQLVNRSRLDQLTTHSCTRSRWRLNLQYYQVSLRLTLFFEGTIAQKRLMIGAISAYICSISHLERFNSDHGAMLEQIGNLI